MGSRLEGRLFFREGSYVNTCGEEEGEGTPEVGKEKSS